MLATRTVEDKFKIFGMFLTILLLAGFAFAIITGGKAGLAVFFTAVTIGVLVVAGIGTLASGIAFIIEWLG